MLRPTRDGRLREGLAPLGESAQKRLNICFVPVPLAHETGGFLLRRSKFIAVRKHPCGLLRELFESSAGAHPRAKILEHAIGIDNQREDGGVTEPGMNKRIRDSLVFGGVHKHLRLVEMALDFPVGHTRQKFDVESCRARRLIDLPERLILNRTDHPTARARQTFREVEEEVRSLYRMAACHPEKVDLLVLRLGETRCPRQEQSCHRAGHALLMEKARLVVGDGKATI